MYNNYREKRKDFMNNETDRANKMLVNEAVIFAAEAHLGQLRKGTNLPYIVHPLEAMAIVATMTEDPEILAAMVLHDVVEDTSFTMEDVKCKFGERVAKFVAADTENKREDRPARETWKVRKTETHNFVRNVASREEKMIVLGDKLSNLRAIYKDYLRIGDRVWDKFACNSREEQGWYYKEFVELFAEFSGEVAYEEYKELVGKVFGFSAE